MVPRPGQAFVRSRVDAETERYLYWPERRIVLDVDEAGNPEIDPADMRGAVQRSLDEWSRPDCTDLDLVYGSPVTTNPSTNLLEADAPDLRNVLVWRSDDWPEDLGPDVGAITTLVFDLEGVILDGDIDFNGAGFRWTASDDSSGIDVESNVTHEVGHLIGLDHTPDREATMYYAMVEGDLSRRDLSDNEVAGVCFIYPAGEPTPEGTLPEAVPDEDDSGGCSVVRCRDLGQAGTVALLVVLAIAIRRGRDPATESERRVAVQRRRRAAGLCACGRRPAAEHRMCPQCLLRQRRRRRRLRGVSLCIDCGQRRSPPGRTRCAACAEHRAQYRRDRKKLRKLPSSG